MAFQSIRDINPNTTQRPRSGFDPSGFSNIGRDPSVPPQLRRDSGISALPSGPDIRMKSKPSAPSYNFNRGQVGGMRDIPSYAKQPYYTNVEATRQKYFDNRPDVSRDRLIRRSEQDRLYENFKNTQMKPVAGASNLYQSVTPGGPTLSDEAMRLANIYGPTPSEIYGDIKYGMGQFGKAIAEKWVDIGAPKKDGKYQACGRSQGSKRKYPKCVPLAKATSMSSSQKASAVRRKRAAGNTGPKPTNVKTFVSKKTSRKN